MSRKSHRSFTLRVDTDFYLELAAKAQAEGIPLNQLANRLLRLGLGEQVSVEDQVRVLLLRMVNGPAVAEGAPA